MKKWFVLLFYLFCSFQSNAKNYVLENNFDSKFVGKDLLFLEDENCNFNVNDINKATVKWESLTEKPFFFWKAEKCFWYKLSILIFILLKTIRSLKNTLLEMKGGIFQERFMIEIFYLKQ